MDSIHPLVAPTPPLPLPAGAALCLALAWVICPFAARADALPGPTWTQATPADAGLDATALESFTRFVGGRGVVVRHGFLVHAWGDIGRRADVASACKPVFAHFLFRALADRRIPSLDEPVLRWEPRLNELNDDLGFKDRGITWRHLANQTSCYGLAERPGTAFAYNDWQIALFADLLFNHVYATPWKDVDAHLLGPMLTDRIHCEDTPSFTAHAGGSQPGRLAISPRDFARIGLLYLHLGRWNHQVLLPPEWVRLATRTPLPATLPRAGTQSAPMLPGQRTLGSRRIPDNQTEHFGSYSFLWWINGTDRDGQRHWPDAPIDTYAALGHGGKRALWIVPSLDLVVSWNDSTVESPAQENEALRHLVAAVRTTEEPTASAPLDPPHPQPLRGLIETDAAPPVAGIAWTPPPELAGDFGSFRPVLKFNDGRPVTTPAEWAERRQEILRAWHDAMGAWPPLLDAPRLEVLHRERMPGESFERRRVRLDIAPHQTGEGWLLVPDGPGPFPAVLVPFYEPETSIGLGRPMRDFARQLSRRGFVTLSIGSPGGDARRPDTGSATCQPLSFLAYIAANSATALARVPGVDPQRLGVVGHSYGGKWALFAACLEERFAAAAWSDPGIVWDERRSNVNYWDVWYLGRAPGPERHPGVPSVDNPATGAYRRLVDGGHDLHELLALMAPRPFLVSGGAEDPVERWKALNHVLAVNQLLGRSNRVAMTLRPTHDPTEASNAQLLAFFEHTLGTTHPPRSSHPPRR